MNNRLVLQLPAKISPKEGEVFEAMIDSVNDKTVRLNFNHPLAGKELHFSVKIIELRV